MGNKKNLLESVKAIDEAVTVACEMTGTTWSASVKAEVVKDLMAYDT